MLSPEQRAEFDRDGIVALRKAFSPADAARMQAVIWSELHSRYGIERDDPTTWGRHPPTGLKTSKRSPMFEPICGPVVAGALDDLFGPGCWARPKTFGNVLVTMPDADEWRVPSRIWHADFEPTNLGGHLFAVKLWALCDDVAPGGGGTPQLAGSHRLFERYLRTTPERGYKAAKLGFLGSHPWLRALTHDDGAPDRNEQLLDVEVDLDGLPARVVELTGEAGDVFITHAWVFHTIAVNATSRPRLMRSVAVREHHPAPQGAARYEGLLFDLGARGDDIIRRR